MNPEDAAADALAGLNNRGNDHSAVIEATGDEVNTGSTASAARRLSKADDSTELVVVSSTNDSVEKKSRRGRKRKEDHTFHVEPRVIQVIKKPRTYINHSYRDFSLVPAEMDYEAPEKISDMTFAQKVHHILSQEEYKNLIDWLPHGRAFRILSPKRLEQAQILEKYVGHGRYSSFLRQLSNHGFKHISRGPDRNSYYYEFFLRGLPHLANYMPEPKDARRLIPDPENELDFYAVSSNYPLPDDPGFKMAKPVEEAYESKKRAASESGTISPEPSWFQNQIPPAKCPALQSDASSASMGLVASAAVAPLERNPFPASAVSSRERVGDPNASARAVPHLHDAANGASKASLPNGQSTQAFMANSDVVNNLLAVAGGPSNLSQFSRAFPSADVMSQLQDVINSNNQLLAAVLRAQLESVPQPQQPQQQLYQQQQQLYQQQQQLPEFGSNPLTAEVLAAMLRARRGL